MANTEDDGSDDDKDDHHNEQARPPGDAAAMKSSCALVKPHIGLHRGGVPIAAVIGAAFQVEELASAEPQSVG